MASSNMARPNAFGPVRQPAQTWTAWISWEALLILSLVLIGLVAHGFNMFNYPAFTFNGDEGIYTGQALAVLRDGRLSSYTYWYDHAPGGWILLAGWMAITGGPHTFGEAIDSGRVFMLLLHLAMVPLLFRIARKFGCGVPTATLATLLFSLSPLAIFYQRLVMLDNIMLFWLLVSLNLLLDGHGRLSRIAMSGVTFALALLTKETAIYLLPAMLFVTVRERRQHHGRFGIGAWLLPMILVTSWYPLYAVLKGEFLPLSLARFFGNDQPHVSLLETLLWQLQRDGGGMFNFQNQFWQLVRTDWLVRDPVWLAFGIAATVLNLLRGFRNRNALAVGLFGILPLYYLGRGGLVSNFYILFAIPFVCLNVAVLLEPLFARLPGKDKVGGLIVTAAVVGLSVFYWIDGAFQPLYTQQSSRPGRETISWIRQSLPAESFIVADDAFWPALRVAKNGERSFPNVHSHWKVGGDPEVADGLFRNDWRRIDYLIMTPGLEQVFANQHQYKLALEAYQNAQLVKRWQGEGTIVELWKVNKADKTGERLLASSASYISGRFEHNGAYMSADDSVVAQSQANAMLRAVWSDDRVRFDRAWNWTRANVMNEHGLLKAQWRNGGVVDGSTASDADTDAALALLLGARRWNDAALRQAGVQMVNAIWEHEVVTIDGVPYMTAGDWATDRSIVALNPSYFAPYAYRIFQEIDPNHDWKGVVDSSYDVLNKASAASLGSARSAGLPPDWVGLDRATGELVPLRLDSNDATVYGPEAARTYWRIALDLRWSGDERAATYLRTAEFLKNELMQTGSIGAVYARDGQAIEKTPSPIGLAGAIAGLSSSAPDLAARLYAEHIVGGGHYSERTVYWGSDQDLAAQEWSWFATALYANALPKQ